MHTSVTAVDVANVLLIVLILVAFRARRWVGKLLKSNKKHDPRALENPKYGSVSAGADCLEITNLKGDSSKLPWSEIEEVHAYKRDLFSIDLICLAFRKAGKDEYYEIDEDMAGYHDLIEALPSRLPKFNMEWYGAVAFPAFKTNHKIIWKRSPGQADQAPD